MRVLVHEWVTGGGLAGRPIPASLGAEGAAMRRAVADDFAAIDGVEVIATRDDRFPPEGARWESMPVAPGREEAALRGLARECHCSVLIAPETGGVLRRRVDWIEGTGTHHLGPTTEAIDLAGDKLRLAEHWRRCAIPTPRTVPLDEAEALPEFPVVVKPRDGAGCLDTILVRDRDALRSLAAAGPGQLAQAFVPGAAMSASFVVTDAGEPILVGVGWQHVATAGGRFEYRGGRLPGPRDLGLGPPLDAIRSVPGLRGFVGVDFIHEEEWRRTTVLEINPRVTTSFVGWQALLGRGTMARLWLGAAGLDGHRPAPSTCTRPTTAIRFDVAGTIREEGPDGPGWAS